MCIKFEWFSSSNCLKAKKKGLHGCLFCCEKCPNKIHKKYIGVAAHKLPEQSFMCYTIVNSTTETIVCSKSHTLYEVSHSTEYDVVTLYWYRAAVHYTVV